MVYKLAEVQKGKGCTGPVDSGGGSGAARTLGVSTCDCGLDKFLPRWTHWAVLLLTACIRIYYIGQPQSMWILHPDEIFQTVEGKGRGAGVEDNFYAQCTFMKYARRWKETIGV